ncbi:MULTISPECIES: PhoH family protein [Cysteiniphilum]|uniref:PhoH-like protein n=1 Tax=Cysteiniphilum litorale TaxID=2056700 RepID=A0A8J3EAC7_9GAMM|nr:MULTISPECIES: PhoH family protein [Cysteiniphilum]MDA0911217.1 PhoH family protein [Pseudomonadota bacterium]WHN65453.1 PhoH family protein [Cysteiniphilum sp. QT6929]GGG05306.1 nucleoside triphosphate hydrolase [Cysteiniphilum litorale]
MKSIQFYLEPDSAQMLAKLCGNLNENLHLIEKYLAVEIIQRGNNFRIVGPKTAITDAREFLEELYEKLVNDVQFELNNKELNIALNALAKREQADKKEKFIPEFQVMIGSRPINPRTVNQERYLKRIQENDINFGIGPAGTGKTYLAMACAVAAFEKGLVKRLVLVRPAVEAGEKLGFLPGDLAQKVDPYLRPMYDALYDLMGVERVGKLIEKQIIEIAPLAYMRGRTINDSFIILDESQNTTKEQMKMFLTRIGFNSTAIVTGDITQVDLPKGVTPGLRHAIEVLAGVEGISMTFFETIDVVRHPIVQRVVAAYDVYEQHHSQDY